MLKLQNDCNVALKWFPDNFMKLNVDKFHLMVLWERCDESVTIEIGNIDVVNSSKEKLFRVHIDSKRSLDYHTSRNFAKKLAKNWTHLPAYPRIWINTN